MDVEKNTRHWIEHVSPQTRRSLLVDLTNRRVDLNLFNRDGKSLAWVLVEQEEVALVEQMMQTVVNPNTMCESRWWTRTNRDGDTVLRLAVRRSNARLVRALLSLVDPTINPIAAATIEAALSVALDVECGTTIIQTLVNAAPTAALPHNALHAAVKSGNVATANAWLSVGCLVEAKDEWGCVPAHWVQDTAMLEVLLPTVDTWVYVKRNNRALSPRDREEFPAYCTPLDVMSTSVELVARMLAAMSEATRAAVQRRRDGQGRTLLHTLVAQPMAADRLQACNICSHVSLHTIQDIAGDTVLHTCASQSGLVWWSALWNAWRTDPAKGGGTTAMTATDANGQTVAHRLAHEPSCTAAQLTDVFTMVPTLIDAQDNDGNTPMHKAYGLQRGTLMRGLVVPDGSRVWSIRNDASETVGWRLLSVAAAHTVDPNGLVVDWWKRIQWDERAPNGAALLVALVRELGTPADEAWFVSALSCMEEECFLLACNCAGRGRRNVLHELAERNGVELLTVLPRTIGPCVNAFDAHDESPLMIAVRLGHHEFVVAYYERFRPALNLRAPAPNGLTVVDVAHEYERDDTLAFLITKDDRLHVEDLQLRLHETQALYDRQANRFTCLRCHQHPRALFVLPCRHVTYCALCADRIDSATSQCFICGNKAESVALINWTHDVLAQNEQNVY